MVFSVTRNGRPEEDELLAELVKYVDKEDIKAIQCAHSSNEYRITLKHEPAKNAILAATIKMNNKDIMLSEAEKKTDWITIAEAPVEMNDTAIIAALSAYGTVLEDSMRRGYVRGHKGLENGTRYVAIVNMQELPDELEIDGFPVKLYHRETKCTHCGMTGHKSFRCPVKPDTRRRCFRCGSSSHLKNDCENEVVCNFCRQTGHMIADCDENREHRVGWRFGARNEAGSYQGQNNTNNQVLNAHAPVWQTPPSKTSANFISPTIAQTVPEKSVPHEQQNSLANTVDNGKDDVLVDLISFDEESEKMKPNSIMNTMNVVSANGSGPMDSRTTLLIGASNLNYIEPPDGVMITNKSGAVLTDAISLVKLKEEELGMTLDPEKVVLHLGTNDVTKSNKRVAPVAISFQKTLFELKERFPTSTLVLCSIPPRRGTKTVSAKDTTTINQVSLTVNSIIKEQCDQSDGKMMYVDNWYKFYGSKRGVLHRLYANDGSGIHLNKDGKALVMNNIMKIVESDTSTKKRKQACLPDTPLSAEKNAKGARLDQDSPTMIHDSQGATTSHE